MYDIQQCNTNYRALYKHFIINPRCACARGLQYLLTLGVHAPAAAANAQTKVRTALIQYSLDFGLVDFCKNASFRSYGVICLQRLSPALLQWLVFSTTEASKVV